MKKLLNILFFFIITLGIKSNASSLVTTGSGSFEACNIEWVSIGNITISEDATQNGDFAPSQTNLTYVLYAPIGFEFNTAFGGLTDNGDDITLQPISVTADSVTITITTDGTGDNLDAFIITGLQVKRTTATAGTYYITYKASSSTGTWDMADGTTHAILTINAQNTPSISKGSATVNENSCLWTTISDIAVDENTVCNFDPSQASTTFILDAPTGFEFKPSTDSTSSESVADNGFGFADISSVSINVTADEIQVTISTNATEINPDMFTISGIEITPTTASGGAYTIDYDGTSSTGAWNMTNGTNMADITCTAGTANSITQGTGTVTNGDGTWQALGDIVVAEGSNTGFDPSQTTLTYILDAPAGVEFKPSTDPTSFEAVADDNAGGADISAISITVTANEVQVTITTDGVANATDQFTISGVEIKWITASGGTYDITYDAGSSTGCWFATNGQDHGTITVNVPSYDFYEGAIDVSSIINSCSADAAYTTIGMTSDKNAGSTWNTSPNYNVWFKFQATTTSMKVTIDRGGVKGTIRRVNTAIWQSDGTTEVSSKRYISDNDIVFCEAVENLTIGNWYYISVDNDYSGYRGTFTLCLADNDISYDFYEGAIDVSSIINSCSVDAAYTTIGMTSDKNAASTWNTSPNYNVWFKFQATTTSMKITIDRGGSKGTIRRVNTALWELDGTTEVESKRYISDNDVVVNETVGGLTVGNWYYISVDNNYSGYRGTFTLCLADNDISYDFYEGAIDVSSIINSCSADAEYTTIGMTSDKNAASTWNTSPNYNVWFKFQATTTSMKVTIDRGGSKGTIRRVNTALWKSDGITEVASKRYISDNEVVVNETVGGLTVGNWYYISVDNNYSGYRGTFTLCLADNDISYDYYEGAIDVSFIIDSCSVDAEYTTIGMTSDKNAGSTWNTSPNYNVWFKFQATSFAININILRGGSYGTLRRVNAALWESDGITEVTSNRYVSDNDNVLIGSTDLVEGNWYYISVDNDYSGYRGTFSLCIDDDVDYDYYEGATILTNLSNWSSSDAEYTTIGATSDKNAGSCWNTSPNYNRWFKFQATTDQINIKVNRGGSYGTIRRVNLALWESDGTTQVACNRYVSDNDIVSISAFNLTIGNWYYVSIDNNYSGYRGTFSLYVNDVADYDYYEGAIEISDLNNWCSEDATYTTIGATSDKSAGSTWNTSPNYNRWFKFQAISDGIQIVAKRGGTYGTVRRINLALWESDGITEVVSNRYVSDNDNVDIGVTGLTIGNWYYISVDNNYSGYRGTFTLCVDDNPTYDYKEGAVEITDLDNWCSADAEYTTIGATSDESAASCWNTSPNYNRWFKFQAIFDTLTVDVKRGGSFGTVRRLNVAVFREDGNEVGCSRYAGDNDNIQLTVDTLTVGDWYYISVDNNYSGYRGTFTLCVNNVSNNEYFAIVDGNWTTNSTWSLVEGGSATTSYPTSSNKVNIKGYDVAITSNEECATLDIEIDNDVTSLTIDGASLTVNGDMDFVNQNNNYDGSIIITNGGTFNVGNDITFHRNGGANLFKLHIQNNSSMNIYQDMTWNGDLGTINNNEMILDGNAILNISRDLKLDRSGGMKIITTLNNTSILTVSRDMIFTANAVDMTEIELNSTATLNIGRDFVRGATPYGILDCNDNSTVVYNGSSYLQTMAENTGSGTDNFTYQNVIINNTKVSSPQITLEGDVTIEGTLTMTSGDIDADTYTLTLGTSTSNIGILSHTSGSIIGEFERWLKLTTPTTYLFPLGTYQYYRPVVIEFTNLVDGSLIGEYKTTSPANAGLPVVDGATSVYDAFTEGYWSLTTANSLSSNDYDLEIEGNGMTSFDIIADTRLLTRANSSSDWTSSGSHVAATGNTIKRDNITTLSAEYTFGDNTCVLSTSAITGNDTVYEYDINTDYFVSSRSGYSYNWTVVGGTIKSGDGTNLIVVDWDVAGTGNVSVVGTNNGCNAVAVDIDVEILGPFISNGTGGGDWNLTTTWLNGVVPSVTDIVDIDASDVVNLVGDVTVVDITIDGDLNNNGHKLTITGDYEVNGTHSATGADQLYLSGTNTYIKGTGTMDMNGQFRITGGNKIILSSADINIISGDFYISSDLEVSNNGIITLSEDLVGENANSKWINFIGSTLNVSSVILSTGILDASALNNTVVYEKAGNQDIEHPLNDDYYNLTLSGSGTKLLTGNIDVNGGLTISNAGVSLDVDVASNYNISIEGYWLNSGSFLQRQGTVTLDGTVLETITSVGTQIYYNLILNKSGVGGISLNNSIEIENTITLTDGNVVLGANDLIISNSASGAIVGGSSSSYIQADGTGKVIWDVAIGNTMIFPVGDNDEYSPFTFTLNGGTLSSPNISINLTDAKHPSLPVDVNHYITRYWRIIETGIADPGIDYNVSCVYLDADIEGTEADIDPILWSSGAWTTGGSTNVGSNTLSWNNITSFSNISGGDAGEVLPIELLIFEATLIKDVVEINWVTATEINNDYFTIEKTNDVDTFEEVAIVNGAGNSNEVITYQIIDDNPYEGISYYRLKQTDYNGKYTYSDLILIEYIKESKFIFKVYPNPTQKGQKTYINFEGLTPGTMINVKVTDILGQVKSSTVIISDNTGSIIEAIDPFNKLTSGTYIIISSTMNKAYSKILIIK